MRLAVVDKAIREGFFDPRLKGVDWPAALQRATRELSRAATPAEQNAAYDQLLSVLEDSHTFRVPAGRLPERNWGTAGLRMGQDGGGYAVKGIIPGGSADAAGLKIGDRILAVNGVPYGKARVNFRDLFLAVEGMPGSLLDITWQPAGGPPRTDHLLLRVEARWTALWLRAPLGHERGNGSRGRRPASGPRRHRAFEAGACRLGRDRRAAPR